MLPPGALLHTSSIISTSVGLDSRSVTEKVTVFLVMDPEDVESTGTLKSIVTVAPVDSHGMTMPPLDERMFSKAADSCAVRELVQEWKETK